MRSWIFDQYAYWSQAIKHAYTWTRDLFLDFAVLLAVFIYNDVRICRDSGRSTANEVSIQTFWSSIYPTGLAFLMLFMFRLLIIAPFRIDQERQMKIVALSDRLRKYEDRQATKLHFVFSHLPPYEILERDTADHRVWRFRVGVKNVWQERLHQCCVKLDAISPRGERFLSRNLKLATDSPSDVLNIPHKQAFPLNPDEEELIDVVRVHQRTNGSGRSRNMLRPGGSSRSSISRRDCETIPNSGRRVSTDFKSCMRHREIGFRDLCSGTVW